MIELGKIQFDVNKDLRGNLIVAEHLPFEIKRVLWFYMMMGRPRGSHATKKTHQILTVIGGSVQITTNSYKHDQKSFHLRDNEYRGLLMPAMTWRTLNCHSRNAICLLLASEPYDEEDYIRDWEEWNALREPRQAVPSVQAPT